MAISGPAEVAPGGSARFTATATMSDGSSRDVTNEAQWTTETPAILAAAAGGVVSGLQVGETTVRATLQSRGANAQVMVIPPGTFRLTVKVFDASAPVTPLSSATITVVGEDGTTVPGRYNSFYGARGRTEVRTTAPLFYESDVRTIDVSAPQDLIIYLKPQEAPALEVNGHYTLTITAAASCASALPEEVRMRAYAAVATRKPGGNLLVILSGASFAVDQGVLGNSIEGTIRADGRADIILPGREGVSWGYQTLLLEQVSVPEGTYEVRGTSIATIDEYGISGPLNGTVTFAGRPPSRPVTCTAKDHSFNMTRR